MLTAAIEEGVKSVVCLSTDKAAYPVNAMGTSKAMMEKAIGYIINDLDKSKIKLSGQAYLEKFYTDLGFERVSDCYLEDGIDHFEFLFEKN